MRRHFYHNVCLSEWFTSISNEKLLFSVREQIKKRSWHFVLWMGKKVRNGNQLQESLRRVWWQDNKHDAALVLDDWIEQARNSGVKPLMTVADTFLKHHDGILAWYDFPITNGKLEGINNKIKTMKRQAYGYRDMPFFKLKLLSLHDSSYPFSGWTKKQSLPRQQIRVIRLPKTINEQLMAIRVKRKNCASNSSNSLN